MKSAASVFPKKETPKPGDWMYEHKEKVQSIDEFRKKYSWNVKDKRRKLYVQPLQLGDGLELVNVKVLGAFLKCFFFGLETCVLPELVIDGLDDPNRPLVVPGFKDHQISHRSRFDSVQLLTGDVMALMKKVKDGLDDARCVVAVTAVDVYPEEAWNFVFGQASLKNGVGVFSFARYASKDKLLELTRCLKTMVHETAHMLGIHHCQKFKCIMNGANSLAETDDQPIHMCAECLEKLVVAQPGLNLADRYRRLIIFFSTHKLNDAAVWCSWRLKELE
jgi:archaemetzincin